VSRVDFPEIYSPRVWVRGEGRFIGGLRFCLPLVSILRDFLDYTLGLKQTSGLDARCAEVSYR